ALSVRLCRHRAGVDDGHLGGFAKRHRLEGPRLEVALERIRFSKVKLTSERVERNAGHIRLGGLHRSKRKGSFATTCARTGSPPVTDARVGLACGPSGRSGQQVSFGLSAVSF